MLIDGFLLGLLIVAVIFDIRVQRIPNLLILVGLGVALLYHGYFYGAVGLWMGIKGLGTGLLLLIIPFLKGGLGAGDVKLLGIVGAVKGSSFVLSTFLWMALWGGFMAVVVLLMQKRLRSTVSLLGQGLWLGCHYSLLDALAQNPDCNKSCYPYGLAIALGVLSSYCGGWW